MRWTVVVAHRKAMVAEAIGAALDRYDAIVPVAAVATALEAEQRGERVDAAALDVGLPGVRQAASRLRRRGVRVVFITDERDEPPRKREAERRVSLRAPVAALASALVPGIRGGDGSSQLTNREREILGLLAQGLAAKQVARSLGISPKTVEHHKARIFRKLRVSNQTAAVSVALGGRGGSRLTA
ncbi:MAG: response regulator transcription factor [Actinomycetota bacterium]|jgi:DNA-binding NarL/FixJ family response regulator